MTALAIDGRHAALGALVAIEVVAQGEHRLELRRQLDDVAQREAVHPGAVGARLAELAHQPAVEVGVEDAPLGVDDFARSVNATRGTPDVIIVVARVARAVHVGRAVAQTQVIDDGAEGEATRQVQRVLHDLRDVGEAQVTVVDQVI